MPIIDEDDDTTGQDRGDTLTPEQEAAPEPGKGKDAKTAEDKGDDVKDDKVVEIKDDDTKTGDDPDGGEDPLAKKDDDEEEDPEGDDAGADKGKGTDPKNADLRIRKALEQRDKARIRAQELEERLGEALKLVTGGKTKEAEPEDPAVAINAELDSLYEKVEEARSDADTKTAAKLQRDIDRLNRELVTLETKKTAAAVASAQSEDARYDTMLDQLERTYAVLNPKSDEFDPAAVKALEFYVAAHEKMGYSATRALSAAARVVFGAPPAPEKTADKKVDDKKPADKKPDNKVVNIKPDANKAKAAQEKQPPDSADRGVNKEDQEIDPSKLTDEEWDAVPASKRRQMRGDNG